MQTKKPHIMCKDSKTFLVNYLIDFWMGCILHTTPSDPPKVQTLEDHNVGGGPLGQSKRLKFDLEPKQFKML